jgi:hypothetical protein
MDVDLLYSYLIFSAWLFLGSWVVFLTAASVMVFSRDSSVSDNSYGN